MNKGPEVSEIAADRPLLRHRRKHEPAFQRALFKRHKKGGSRVRVSRMAGGLKSRSGRKYYREKLKGRMPLFLNTYMRFKRYAFSFAHNLIKSGLCAFN